MQKTKIEWADYVWNPVVGCLNDCPYCYARKIARRFEGTGKFPKGFKPWFFEERLKEPLKVKKPSRIFVCSMGELFGHWVPKEWICRVMDTVGKAQWHTFMFLTKCPWELWKVNFPWNAWVGVTVNRLPQEGGRVFRLAERCNARVKFVSLEPMFTDFVPERYLESWKKMDWVIVGAQTNPYRFPERAWVEKVIVF